ncbi:MAG: RNA-binding protein [Thermofilum sp. ex4484_79]|nr:MAG: RNA-binding protein [Thermofilum sp. ex4484_79]
MNYKHQIISILKKDAILSLLKKNERIDGRGLEDFREIEIYTNIYGKAEGSARVHLGETKVVAGVKASIGTPFPDTPNIGVQVVNAELIPLASSLFEAGPPGEEDIEFSRVIDRGIRSSGMIAIEKLALIPGKKVWMIFIDMYPLDYHGNLMDAFGLVAVSALLTCNIYKTEIVGDDVVVTEEKIPLPVNHVPVFVTIGKIQNKLIVDPNFEEELVLDAKITYVVDENNNICGIQKSGASGFTIDELLTARDIAIKVASKIRKKLPLASR